MYLKNKSQDLQHELMRIKVGTKEDLRGKDKKVYLKQFTYKILHVFWEVGDSQEALEFE